MSDLLIVDRCRWIKLITVDGSSSRSYYFTREKMTRENIRKQDRIIGSFQDMVWDRAKELRNKMPGVTKEDLDQ